MIAESYPFQNSPTQPFRLSRRNFLKALGGIALLGLGTELGLPAAHAAGKDIYAVGGNLTDFTIHRFKRSKTTVVPTTVNGHGFFQHPLEPNLVFAVEKSGQRCALVDIVSGKLVFEQEAPKGRFYYGHFSFTHDGRWIFSSQVDPQDGQGYFTVYDSHSMKMESEHKIVPGGNHDIAVFPDKPIAIITSSGVRFYGKESKNKHVPAKRVEKTSLVFFDYEKGQVIDKKEWPDESLLCGHIKVLPDKRIICLMTLFEKYEGNNRTPYGPLLWTRLGNEPLHEIALPPDVKQGMKRELLSVGLSVPSDVILVTNPENNKVLAFSLTALRYLETFAIKSQGVAFTEDGTAGFFGASEGINIKDFPKTAFSNFPDLTSSHISVVEV